jgi:hypothetical protein
MESIYGSLDIGKPSENYKKNILTFAYRLSELVFGSLLAAYLLGFVSACFTIIQVGRTSKYYYLQNFVSLMRGEPQVAPTTIELQSVDIDPLIVCLQYLLNSISFSVLTAFFYFTFQQTVLHIETDFRKSYFDFIWACLVGIFFGFTMLFPFTSLFVFGLVIFCASIYKWLRFRGFWWGLAETVTGAKRGSKDAAKVDAAKMAINKKLRETTSNNATEHLVIKQWRAAPQWQTLIGGIVLIIMPPFFYVKVSIGDMGWGADGFAACHLLGSVVLFVVLVWQLSVASNLMPLKEVKQSDPDKLDDAFLQILTSAIPDLQERAAKAAKAAAAAGADK